MSHQTVEMPVYWRVFVEANDLLERDIEVPEAADLSDLGAMFRVMTQAQCHSEAVDAFPGKVAACVGFYPVGMCLEGSGDYYYLQTAEGEKGALYRIYHDSVSGNTLSDDGVERVLDRYEDILSYLLP